MGGSSSSYTETDVTNIINQSIENYTTTINKVTQDVTNKTLNKLTTDNQQILSSLCGATNNIDMSCNFTDVNLTINQNLNENCLAVIISNIENKNEWQTKFATTLNSQFANAVKNDTSLVGTLAATNYLSNLKKSDGLGGMLKSVTDTIGSVASDLTGSSSSDTNITKIMNAINTHFMNKSYTENDINNIIKNISENMVTVNNIGKCDLTTQGLNNIRISNCSWDKTNANMNQNSSIISVQKCAQGYINDTTLKSASVTDALDKATNSIENKGSASADLIASNTVIKKDETTGSLFGSIFGDLFSGLGKYIMIAVICIVVIVAIVIGLNLLKSHSDKKA